MNSLLVPKPTGEAVFSWIFGREEYELSTVYRLFG